MKDIRIAAVIFNAVVGQVQQNLERMIPWVERAKAEGADLICFPELNVTGYSTNPVIKDSAESIPGPISRKLEQIAGDSGAIILAGMAERDDKGRLFASHLVVLPDGIAGTYRKLHIAPPEKAVFSQGQRVSLFNIGGINVGIQLCYDAHFPELSTRMAIDGADVIFMPHASPRGTPPQKLDSWMRHLSARAFDNGVFIVACNQVGENQIGLEFPGLAVAIGPSGNIMKDKTSDSEGMLIADLKAKDLSAVRNHRMRYFLPNRRPDLY
ncbi:MAG: nitrilase [Deltaproteobacteria bacterium]|jgi:N-carbamoylputrescine amidase|nr:nitrilase [Deltaproteobacteria bacterium]MBW2482189.1 nitrilase [Deltaproteobacteria bacterium]